MEPEGSLLRLQKHATSPRQLWTFHNMEIFYGEELLVPALTPKL